MTDEEELAAGFETQRSYLHAIAFRLLGSHADADVDVHRRRGVRAEQPLEISVVMLPREVAGDWRTDPEEEALLADSVGLALYVVMDALTPAERVSFVFPDVFEVPFGAIATILGRSTAATKMLASRARGRVRLGTPPAPADTAAREVVDAFLAAVGGGDLAGLLAVHAPQVELRARGPEKTAVVRGAREVADRATMAARPRADARAHPALIDGAPGILITVGGRPVMIMASTVADGAITAIRTLTRPGPAGPGRPSWVT